MRFSGALILLLLLAACSGRQVYDAGQGWRQSECSKESSPEKQQQCLDEANRPFELYQRERDAATRP